jgi:hypothetical protein
MKKQLIIISGVVTSIVAIVAILYEVDDRQYILENYKSQKTSIRPLSEEVGEEIKYVTHKKEKVNKVLGENKNSVIKREKYLESKTYDNTRRFELSLINKNKDSSKKMSVYTTLQGSINGNSFFLHVPDYLIDEGSGITQLRIKDLKTGEVKFVTAAFLDDMRNPKEKQKISLDFDDVQNYQQTTINQIIPLRPGERRN